MTAPPRKADLRRWRREIVDLLADFPRQHAALETAMSAFGEGFELSRFKRAYDTETDMDAYNRVQAVERALGRVQNYVADLSIAGVKLAGLDLSEADHDAMAPRAFRALKDTGAIGAELCRRLIRAQKARTMIEHSYVKVPAGNSHRAAVLVRESSREFHRALPRLDRGLSVISLPSWGASSGRQSASPAATRPETSSIAPSRAYLPAPV